MAKTDKTKVKPLRGLAPWIGGKRLLAGRIATLIESTPHRIYAEPFAGMGGVFFRRRRPAPVEVLNDINGDIVNLFRIVQRHPAALFGELRFRLFSRVDFERLDALDPAALTDVERAARFIFLQRTSYYAKAIDRCFQSSPHANRALTPMEMRRRLIAAHRRLAKVTIERLPYQEFIRRYDRPASLFYLDPPYWGCERVYGKGLFGRGDFEVLSGLLRGLKGRFILSLNDVPETRRLFSWARLRRLPVTYKGGTKHAHELIITPPTS